MDNTTLLREEAYKGLERIGKRSDSTYTARLERELAAITKLGFVPYFLVVWDVAKFVRRQKLIPSPGRGSAAGSLVAFCLGITGIDPIKYHLLFERFINDSRAGGLPDIDFDIGDRESVLTYIEDKYGHDKVARVGTIGFLRTKSAIRDICRVLEKEKSFVDELIKLVPPPVAGLWDSFQAECNVSPDLRKEKYQEIISLVEPAWGLARSMGTHAGGIAISPIPITDFIPLYLGKEDKPTSQCDWRDLEKAGLIKFDILGLSTLRVIQSCVDSLRAEGREVELETLEDGDPLAYDLLCQGNLDGIFQLGGSEGIKQTTVAIGPRSLEDLSAITSLFRPGPIGAKMVEKYINVRSGTEKASFAHPILEKILAPTMGVIIYQEDLMRICVDLCGYTLQHADFIRKYLGKKQQDKLAAEEPNFIAGAVKNGMTENGAKELFNQVKWYGQYLFNRCLSQDTLVRVHHQGQDEDLRITQIQEKIASHQEVLLKSVSLTNGKISLERCEEVIDCGLQECVKVELSDGSEVTCTMDHMFLCEDMRKHPLYEILALGLDVLAD